MAEVDRARGEGGREGKGGGESGRREGGGGKGREGEIEGKGGGRRGEGGGRGRGEKGGGRKEKGGKQRGEGKGEEGNGKENGGRPVGIVAVLQVFFTCTRSAPLSFFAEGVAARRVADYSSATPFPKDVQTPQRLDQPL